MSFWKKTDGLGPGGDSTTLMDLSKITQMNPSFRRFINGPQSTFTTSNDNSNNNNNLNNDNTIVNITQHNQTFDKNQPEDGQVDQEEDEDHEEHRQQQNDNNSPTISSIKRAPEDVIERLQFRQKRKTLRTSEEELERVLKENLKLKMRLLNLQHKKDSLTSEERSDLRQDLEPVFNNRIQELERELEERDRRDTIREQNEKLREQNKRLNRAEIGCQTNLDFMNIEELLVAKINLRRLEQTLNKPQNYQNQTPHQHQPQQQQHQSHPTRDTQQQQQQQPAQQSSSSQSQNPIMKQLYYPPIVINNKQIMPDEKVLLEQLFKINGLMTTARDILKTKFNLT